MPNLHRPSRHAGSPATSGSSRFRFRHPAPFAVSPFRARSNDSSHLLLPLDARVLFKLTKSTRSTNLQPCSPNAVLVFEGQMAVVRAMENISKDSEVTISYIETAGSTLTRKKSLKEQYLFDCECAHCSNIGKPHDIEESAILEGYRCINEKCTGFLLRHPDEKGFVCQKCMLLRSKEEDKKLVSDVKTVSEKTPSSPYAENKQEAITLYKKMEKLQLLMEVESWREALDYCRLIVLVYQNRELHFLNPKEVF